MSLPNVIIAGAPKCGTTSLYRYLSDHPEVCTARFGETRYLIDKGKPFFNSERNYHTGGIDGYRQLFEHYNRDMHKVIVDVTPDYLYQKTPLHVLPKFNPAPKIVFILRDPAMRTYSLYQFARNNIGIINKNMSFKMFIQMIEDSSGKKGKERFILHDECDKSIYIKYLKGFVDVFGLNGIVICLFEDLKRNPKTFMIDLCRRMNIDGSFYEGYQFNIHNRTFTVRNQKLHRIRRKLKDKIPSKILSKILSKLYNSLNTSSAVNGLTDEDIQVINKLKNIFRPFNMELSKTFNVDLESWNGFAERQDSRSSSS